ncbi:MAG: MFS transporter, partial [Deltaproteobacteria bacterium]|nr:MFS transporter [Deltaproteobacteria bacterium]
AGETGLGLLMSAVGLGALAGSTILAMLGDFRCRGRLMMFSGIVFGASLIFFGSAKSLYPALFYLLIAGGGSSMFMILINSLIMSNTDEELVGRVMSFWRSAYRDHQWRHLNPVFDIGDIEPAWPEATGIGKGAAPL